MDQIIQKRVFPVRKRKFEQCNQIQHMGISLSTKFHPKVIILIVSIIFAIQNKTNEHQHQIQHISISLSTKFYPKQLDLIA